ncbi:hypothetical protein [Streptomyces sp. ALI-76-A]|uniref:hypothetical protein n=1 Tax=Streptomyces sp. ALI-76-A TaxID=3025736 RepID=UPI00256ED7AC|nr:hypothetical protein [Streptomyces sp. ALI-76-A]MDL5200085.1 hypothetical protein [Streptomyces sp. ALI-76-A]
MSEQTPSQAEGEREQDTAPDQEREGAPAHRDVPRTTPPQAEGEGTDGDATDGYATDNQANQDDKNDKNDKDEERSKAWESGWSGP